MTLVIFGVSAIAAVATGWVACRSVVSASIRRSGAVALGEVPVG